MSMSTNCNGATPIPVQWILNYFFFLVLLDFLVVVIVTMIIGDVKYVNGVLVVVTILHLKVLCHRQVTEMNGSNSPFWSIGVCVCVFVCGAGVCVCVCVCVCLCN